MSNQFLPGEHLRGGRGPDVNIRNTYDDVGALTSVLPREGIDIGPRPDFWAEMDEMMRRMPQQRAPMTMPRSTGAQARTVRTAPPPPPREGSAAPRSGPSRGRTPIFRKVIGGAQIIPGYIEADQGDPNAAFAGWRL